MAERFICCVRCAKRAGQFIDPGAVSIGYVLGLFHTFLPEVVTRFRARCPSAAVHLFDLTATEQAKALAECRLDAGFIGFADEADALGLSKKRVGSCHFVAVLPKNHPAARKPAVPLEALSRDFIILISQQNYPGAARLILEACQRAGFRPKTLQTADRGHTILGLVAAQCGVALLPSPLTALPHPGVRFRPLQTPITSDLFVAWNAAHPCKLRDELLASL